MNRTRPLAGAIVAALAGGTALGCSATVVNAATYAHTIGQDPNQPGSVWASLAPGKKAFVAPMQGCAVTAADTFDGLKNGKPLGADPWSQHAGVYTIDDALVSAGDVGDGFLGLSLRDATGAVHWVRLPGNAPLSCVLPADDAIVAAVAHRGRTVAFTPWRPTCTRIEAAGTAPDSALFETEAGTPIEVGDVTLGGPSATSDKATNVPWLLLNGDTVRVRADVLATCFSDAADPAAKPPTDASAYLHIDGDRCSASDEGGRQHLECRTSLGVWEGVVSAQALSLALVRRTLGPVHFLGGHPVAGGRFAKAVVAVTLGASRDARTRALYDAMRSSIAPVLSGDDGTVRVARSDDPGVTYRVSVDVSDMTIGELAQQDVDGQSEYKAGEETKPNPKKDEARDRLEKARNAVDRAEQDLTDAKNELEDSKRRQKDAIDQCREQANNVSSSSLGGWGKALAQTSCDFADMLTQPQGRVTKAQETLSSAKSERSSAESDLSSTPDTITVPIMKTWTFKKHLFSRATSATVKVVLQAQGGQPETIAIPLSHQWSDYTVAADPEHNVPSHAADRGPIDDADAVVPFVAAKAGEAVAVKVRDAIAQATLEQAKRALVAAGETPKPGYEAVDAIAFETAGKRLKRVAQRGTATVGAGKAAFLVPSKAVRLAPTDCVLAVAVADGSGGALTLATPDGSHADARRKRFATVEACANELGGKSLDNMVLESEAPSPAHWALYLTSRGAAAH